MKEKRKYIEATLEILRRSQEEPERYTTNVLGRNFVVRRGVFSPKYFHDPEFFANELPIRDDQKFLEIGTGCGVIAITAALKGARVVAIDINPNAIENIRENATLHDVNIDIREGIIYKPIRPGEKFDIIFWNVPFAYTRRKPSMLERSVLDYRYLNLQEFIRGGRNHLETGGRLFIGFSPELGHVTKLKEFLKTYGYKSRVFCEIKSEEIYPVRFQLYEARLI